MNPSSEVEVGAGEVIAVAFAEHAKFKRGKQRYFNRAGQVHGCAGGGQCRMISDLSGASQARGRHLQGEGNQGCDHSLVGSRAHDVPRSAGIGSVGAGGDSVALGGRPGDAHPIPTTRGGVSYVADMRPRNRRWPVGRAGQGIDGGGRWSLRTLIKLGELRSQVLNACLGAVVRQVSLQVIASHPHFVADHKEQPHRHSGQQNGQQQGCDESETS